MALVLEHIEMRSSMRCLNTWTTTEADRVGLRLLRLPKMKRGVR
jgi:hypothetical protein